jgi:predicted enzyme related to lactoylglutathione lyase
MQTLPHVAALLFMTLGACAQIPEQIPEQAQEQEGEERSRVTHIHHSIDYIEFTVTDMQAAQGFYAAAFGWTFTDYGPEYAGIRKPEGAGEVGGLRLDSQASTEASTGASSGASSGGPLVILYSNDLDGTLERVRAAGGRIVTEPYDFPGGRRFHFADPSGNELAVWSES